MKTEQQNTNPNTSLIDELKNIQKELLNLEKNILQNIMLKYIEGDMTEEEDDYFNFARDGCKILDILHNDINNIIREKGGSKNE